MAQNFNSARVWRKLFLLIWNLKNWRKFKRALEILIFSVTNVFSSKACPQYNLCDSNRSHDFQNEDNSFRSFTLTSFWWSFWFYRFLVFWFVVRDLFFGRSYFLFYGFTRKNLVYLYDFCSSYELEDCKLFHLSECINC